MAGSDASLSGLPATAGPPWRIRDGRRLMKRIRPPSPWQSPPLLIARDVAAEGRPSCRAGAILNEEKRAMHRREFIGSTLAASVALFNAARAQAAESDAPAPLPKRKRVRVAFMLGEHANVIDTCGPWEVFQDAVSPDGDDTGFELFTVAPEEGPLEMTGGLKVLPKYSIKNAPQPHVIVVPAHKSTAESRDWLKI